MATSPTPPPMAAPSMRAITAFGSASAISSSVPKRRLDAAVESLLPPRAASELSMPLRSPPAQKVPPAPISTTTRMPASSRACSNVCVSSRTITGDSAFLASGRLMVILSTGPSRSTISVSCGMGLVSLYHVPSPHSSVGEG